MNENKSQPLRANLLRLPVAIAKNAAVVGRIDQHSFCHGRQQEFWPWKKVADDGLQVPVGNPSPRFERNEAVKNRFDGGKSGLDWGVVLGHENRGSGKRRSLAIWDRTG